MGTWVEDRMQGPGQLVYAHYRFHGFWKRNLVQDIYIYIKDKIITTQKTYFEKN